MTIAVCLRTPDHEPRLDALSTRIIQLTVPSSDNGEQFTRTDRLDLIRQALENSEYVCFADLPLAKVYRHQAFETGNPAILVSCHIDSVYDEYHAIMKDGELHGTFDNSACNAIVVEAMLNGLLPPQVLISFTGDEENDSKGADQTVEILKKAGIFYKLEMVITLDLTEEHYHMCHFTIENYFVEKENGSSLLKFNRKRQLKEYLSEMIASPVFIEDAEADESWQYDEYDLNCYSLCLPCRLLGQSPDADMHDDEGVAISTDSIVLYMNALVQLTHAINKDLLGKVINQD